MAIRRMFSTRITESAKFLKMPPSAQSLYFHLGMNADDDGVVEAYTVMRAANSTDDELKILIAKGFVTLLNEDLVLFIDDWTENNSIRADRKTDSIYKELLLQVVPDAKIKNAKPTYYSRIKEICQTNDGQVTDSCQPFVSISKDMEREEIVEKDMISNDNSISCPETDGSAQDKSGILLPLIDKSFYDVPNRSIKKWREAYPAVDVEQQLKRMIAWLEANPKRRKTRRGVNSFINIWLSREQDKGGRYKNSRQNQELTPEDYELPPEYQEMYRNLAKNYDPGPDDPFQ